MTASTPPAFIVHTHEDDVCDVRESTGYATQLRKHGVDVETHLFNQGGHGFGLGRSEDGTGQWLPLFVNWLTRNQVKN